MSLKKILIFAGKISFIFAKACPRNKKMLMCPWFLMPITGENSSSFLKIFAIKIAQNIEKKAQEFFQIRIGKRD